jgi:ribosomal-protein-alanine N-acetyltransferase
MVAVVDGKIVGYMVYMRCRQGIEVYSIAVDAEHRRQGIARGFIDKLKAKLVKDVVAIVRDKNLAAQLFFKNQDFRATQVLRKWYDNGEDGYMMKFASSVERYKPTNRISNFFVSTTGQ